ncbi:hypothetical protein EW15_1379 [Prochlorococcus sp. MIT 0801]|nr:hypothetical protein EW15_1379 [Prochlorococcus sp. MIT 0801]
MRPPFKRRRFDLIKRSKSNVEVAFNEAILKAVKGQKGLKKNILKFLSSNVEAFWTYRGKKLENGEIPSNSFRCNKLLYNFFTHTFSWIGDHILCRESCTNCNHSNHKNPF